MTTRLTKQQRLGAIMALVCSVFLLLVMSIPTWLVPTDPDRPEYLQPRFSWWDPAVAGDNIFPLLAFLATLAGAVMVVIALIRRRRSWSPLIAYAAALACTFIGILVNGSWRITITVIGILFTAMGMSILLANKQKQPR
ncbi:hypothetical protein AADG42_14210 [Ammonicoccus fulvus]|uniref:Uncharacterized protein n=1 Tax=Ammonicoccus fulvus TaxID=3138240 RepID=A0ABZ3FV13_9ACTN